MLVAADGWTETVPGPTGVTLSANCLSTKVAVTLLAASIVRLHVVAVPAQAPDQPLNSALAAGVAVRVTGVPALYMPLADDGWAETVPGPTSVTLSANCWSTKVAVTLLAISIVTSQVRLLPEHAPDQLLNTEFEAGAAVSLTTVPERYFDVDDDGTAETLPDPRVVTNSEYSAVKVAVTLLVASMVRLQVALLPEHAPDQPVNTKPGSAVAVRPTGVPARYFPAVACGAAATVPEPSVVTNSEYCAVKVAPTVLFRSIVTTHVVLLPEQSSDQPVNAKPASG